MANKNSLNLSAVFCHDFIRYFSDLWDLRLEKNAEDGTRDVYRYKGRKKCDFQDAARGASG